MHVETTSDGLIRLGGNTTDLLEFATAKRESCLRNYYELQNPLGGYNFEQETPNFTESLKFVLNDVRQGIYVMIRGGKPRLILQLANLQYKNTFGQISFLSGDSYEYCRKRSHSQKRKLNGSWVDFESCWASNRILCTTSADARFGWGVGMCAEIVCILERTSTEHTLYDTEFIINKRDLPMLKINGESCYGFANARAPKHLCQLRVFSIYQGITWRDLAFIDPHDASPIRIVQWDKKFECGFFRGTSTGSGTTENTNARIALAFEGSKHWHDYSLWEHQGVPLLDIGLVGISKREKFIELGVVSRDDMGSVPYLRPRVPIYEWGKWKYLFYVEGYSAALRLFSMLSTGSVVVIITDSYSDADKLWFFDSMDILDYESVNFATDVQNGNICAHVISCSVKNAASLVSWLKANDMVARQLATNAMKLFNHLSSTRIAYMARSFNAVKITSLDT
jgi:hypothetical protein